MKKLFKLLVSVITVIAMVIPSVTISVMAAANPQNTKSIYADFEGMTTVGQTTSAYGADTTINRNGDWQCVMKPECTSDAYSDSTNALHIYWTNSTTNYGTVSADPWNSMWNISNLDISSSSVLSFDLKLDKATSQFYIQYRYKKTDGNFGSFNLGHVNGTSALTLLGKSIAATPITSADTWYNITFELSYDSTINKLTGSAWINGSKLVDENTSNLTYNLGTVGISGVAGNYVRFAGYVNGSNAQGGAGIWLDNIMFSQKSPYYFASTPDAGQKITGNTAKLTYAAKLDSATLSDSSVTVTKDGESFAPADVTVKNNTVLVNLSNEPEPPNGEYTITLPQGAGDIRGTLIPESARSLTFRSGDPIVKSFSLVSPSDGAVLENGKEIVIKAVSQHIAGADVEFKVNGESLSNITANPDGSFTAKWTPPASGKYTVTASAQHQSDSFEDESKNIRVLGTNAWSSNWRNVYTNSNPASHGDGTAIANGYTTNSITFKRTQDSAPYTQIYNSSVSSGYTAGYIVAEAEVNPQDGGSFNIANRNVGTDNKTQYALSLYDGCIYYRNGTASVLSDVTYTQDTNHHVKTVWDLADRKIYLYLDGVQLPFVTTMRSDWLNVYQIRFNVPTDKSSDGPSVTITNEKVTYYPPNPVVTGTSFSGKTFEIAYNVALKESTVTSDNVKLYRGSLSNATIEANVSLVDNKKIRITPKNDALIVSSAEYRVEVSENLASTEGAKPTDVTKHSFRTAPGAYGITNAVFRLGSSVITDLLTVSANDTVTFSADADMAVLSDGAWVVLALYGNTDGGSVLKNIKITHVSSSISANLPVTSGIEEGDRLYAYILDNKLRACNDEYYISR